jgi:large subunit ribosomal protein L21e
MVTKVGGSRKKTRSKYKKQLRQKGKISIRRYLQKFKEGDKVLLKTEPAVQNGMYFHRFHSKVGTIKAKRGACYYVRFNDCGKYKEIIVHPVHLKKSN